MTPLLPHVREPAGEPDVCAYCCEEWMDVDPTETYPLRVLGLPTLRELNDMPHHHKEKS